MLLRLTAPLDFLIFAVIFEALVDLGDRIANESLRFAVLRGTGLGRF
jgi:hypothetical protein